MLRKIDTNLWVFDSTFCIYCFKGSTRMTIVRLKNGELWVHSPLEISDSVKREIQKLGHVAYVVAPNNMHYLYFDKFLALFPKAKGYVASSLVKKKKGFKKHWNIEKLKSVIGKEIEQIDFKGHSLGETVFFHKSSKTLIVTDLLYNLQPHNLWFEKMVMRLFGGYGKPSIPIYHKISLHNRKEIMESVKTISTWPIQRIIMAHGEIIKGFHVGNIFKTAWHKMCGY
jgi:hypothetical protein